MKEVALVLGGKNRGGRSKRLGPGSSSASRARAAAAFRRDPRELPAGVAQGTVADRAAGRRPGGGAAGGGGRK